MLCNGFLPSNQLIEYKVTDEPIEHYITFKTGLHTLLHVPGVQKKNLYPTFCTEVSGDVTFTPSSSSSSSIHSSMFFTVIPSL